MIDPREGDVGRLVIYKAPYGPAGFTMEGRISSWNDYCVYVRFPSFGKKLACLRQNLEWAHPDEPAAIPADDRFVDEDGNVWTRPTAEAYYHVCRARDRLRKELDAARRSVSVEIVKKPQPVPVPSHGGPALAIDICLMVGEHSIMHEFRRVEWGTPLDRVEPSYEMTRAFRSLSAALNPGDKSCADSNPEG